MKNADKSVQTPTLDTHSNVPHPSIGGFRWGISDTLALLILAALLLGVYYPMAFQGKIPYDRDTITFFYPQLSYFQEPHSLLWNPYQLGGCSFVANPQAGISYPPNWIFFILPTDLGYVVSTLGHLYLAAVGMYLLARFSRLSVLSALVAACVFCLGGYFTSRLMLRPLLLSAAWFPLVFLCYLYAHYRGVLLGYLFAGVFLAMQILAGMPHNAVYSAMALGIFALYKTIIEFLHVHPVRIGLSYLYRYGVFLIIGILLSAVVILPTLELLPHTVRAEFDYEAATSGSLPWKWLPDIFVGASYHQTRPVGWEFNETNCYVGIIAVWLISFALVGHWRKGVFWFYIGLVLLSLTFALGSNTPVFRLFYSFPYLHAFGVPTLGRLFDIPSRFLGLTTFAIAMLAGYGMEVLSGASIRGQGNRLTRQSRTILLLIALGCSVWAIILSDLVFRFGREFIQLVLNPADRSLMAAYYPYANFGLFTLVFGLFTIAFLLNLLRRRLFQLLLLFCLVADLIHNGSQVGMEFRRPDSVYQPPLAIRYLRERADRTLRTVGIDILKTQGGDIFYTRMKSILTPKLGLFYRLQDVSGYDPLILKRYSRLTEEMVGIAPGETPLRVVTWAHANSPLLDLLRVGYVVGDVHEQAIFRGQMELRVGERRRLRILANRPCNEVRLRSVVIGGHSIRENTQIGEMILRDASGESLLFPIRVGGGLETADIFAEAAHFHHPAQPYRTWSKEVAGYKVRVHNYVCQIPFPKPFHPVEIEFRNDFDVKLVILGVALNQVPSDDRFTLDYQFRLDRVYRNHSALPQAWWVHEAHIEPSENQLIDLMVNNYLPDGNPIDYRRLALLEKKTGYPLQPSHLPEGGNVHYVQWNPERIVLDVESDTAGLLVLSEIKYPGWQAKIYPDWQSSSGGQPAEILAVNYILRGLSLPAGRHRIEMEYRPKSFYYGLMASLLAVILTAIVFSRYRRKFPVRQY